MSTESKNKWRLLHELCLKAKEAKEFETLGAAVDELAQLKRLEGNTAKLQQEQYYVALCDAFNVAWKKLGQWQENPPPIAPQETQIGPGNPFPIPPPPPPTISAPTPQAPGSLDELRKTIVCAITNEKEAVNGQYGGADVGLLSNAIVRKVDKAFADYAAQNAKAIERAAEPVKTPEPWTGDELYEAFRQAVWGAGKKEDWQRFSDSVRDDFLILTMLVNQRMGIAAK